MSLCFGLASPFMVLYLTICPAGHYIINLGCIKRRTAPKAKLLGEVARSAERGLALMLYAVAKQSLLWLGHHPDCYAITPPQRGALGTYSTAFLL